MSRLPRDRRKLGARADAGGSIRPAPGAVLPPGDHPQVVIKGGPSPKDVTISIDGQTPRRAFFAEVQVGIDHAVKVTTRQYAEVDIRLAEADVEDAGFVAVIRRPKDENTVLIEMDEVARGSAPTLRDAVMAALEQLPDESQVH